MYRHIPLSMHTILNIDGRVIEALYVIYIPLYMKTLTFITHP